MFMIYSLPRCGSANFQHILNACGGGELIAGEPFHPYHLADYFETSPATPAELAQAISHLGQKHKGFKHVRHRDSWPFSVAGLNQALLNSNLDVILLTRRNILQRAVSHQMGEQSNLWHPATREERRQFKEFAYRELNHAEIDWHLRHEPALLQAWRNQLRRGHKRWIELAYEDLYAENDPQTRWLSFKKALDFTGIPCPGGQARLEKLLQACSAKINSFETYSRVPGIEAINLLYGSAETGYLF